MKIVCFTLLLITLIMAGFPAAGFAAGREFTIVNATGADFYDLSIGPVHSVERGPNVLHGQGLLNGQSIQIVFPNYNPDIQPWDMLAVSCCGEKLQWQELNLNSAHTITLRAGGLAELN